MKLIFIFAMTLSVFASAQEIVVNPDDCGPLAGCGEIGVGFSLHPHDSGKGYFTKGKASEICPKVMKASSLIGYETTYSKLYPSADDPKCSGRKVFIITEFKS